MSSPLRNTDRHTEIALVGMRFHVLVGILPHERSIPQPLEVDLRVRHDRAPANVLDYRELYAMVSDAVTRQPVEYLEEAADAVLARALAIEGVSWARVAMRKPHVSLGGPLAHAEVAMERTNG